MEIYKLTGETVDMLSDALGTMYREAGCSKKDTMRAKLLLEEALIKYIHRFEGEPEVYFRVYRILGQTRFCVRLRTPSFDPFSLEENPMAFMLQSVMSGFEGTAPSWRYRNAENEIVFTVRKQAKRGTIFNIVVAVLASGILGVLGRQFLPREGLTAFVNDYLEPLSNAYAGLFCVMAVFITFFGFTLSIVHMGDMAAVGAMGGQVMKRFYLTTIGIIAVLTLPILPFFDLSGHGTFNVAAKSIYDVLIGFIPTNVVSPFLNFNSIHIMIIGVMFGFSLLVMGQKGTSLTQLFEEGNLVAIYTNNFINKFIYIYVALKLFAIITTSDFSQLAQAGKLVVFILVGEALIFVFYMIYACTKSKIPMKQYLRTMMPTFVVCLSSANLGAAFNNLVDSLFDAGVDEDTVNLVTNLGSVVFQPASTLVFVASSLFMASAYGVEISVVWVITAVVLSVILTAAAPNIPGASVSVFTLLFAQLGLDEALPLMIAISALLQFPTVAVDVWCLQGETLCVYHHNKNKQKAA